MYFPFCTAPTSSIVGRECEVVAPLSGNVNPRDNGQKWGELRMMKHPFVRWICLLSPPRSDMGLLTLLRRLKRSDREVRQNCCATQHHRAISCQPRSPTRFCSHSLCVFVASDYLIMISPGAHFGSRPRQLRQNHRSEKTGGRGHHAHYADARHESHERHHAAAPRLQALDVNLYPDNCIAHQVSTSRVLFTTGSS